MLIYRLLFSIVGPILGFAMLWRMLRGRETFTHLRERLGKHAALPPGPVIWVHGASNGELTAARSLIEAMADLVPDVHVLVTSNTLSARAMVANWDAPHVTSALAPLDFRWMYRSVMRKMDLRAFVLLEADFWPNRLFAARGCGAKTVLIGGRMSGRSFGTWQRLKRLSEQIMTQFDLIMAQDVTSAQRLSDLGGTLSDHLAELKSTYRTDKTPLPFELRRTTWLAASTHDGEDQTLIEAHIAARTTLPDLRMILAPRHPRRAQTIAALAQEAGLSARLRSAERAPNRAQAGGADCEIYIADTLGEMDQWYRAAYACFVAGSLTPKGGHTPFEPAAHRCAILHGPHTDNFTAAYTALNAHKGARAIGTAAQIAQALIELNDAKTHSAQTSAAQTALKHTLALDLVLKPLHGLVSKAGQAERNE